MNNTLRAGLALSLVLLAISFVNESRWRAAFIALCAINIHFSTAVPLIALLIAYRYPRPRWFLCVWVLAIFVSLAAGSSFATFFGSMIEDSRVDRYLLIDADEAAAVYRVGFRWDFVAYSLIPMIVGWFYINKLHCADVLYRIILCTYLIANAFWILVIRVPFSDRFAYLSWFLIPILLGYPLLQQRVAMPRQRVYYSTLLALSILLKLYILG
jgi:glucan phosphoethanolaminetransferase (alkaline phosphatase superfamily)